MRQTISIYARSFKFKFTPVLCWYPGRVWLLSIICWLHNHMRWILINSNDKAKSTHTWCELLRVQAGVSADRSVKMPLKITWTFRHRWACDSHFARSTLNLNSIRCSFTSSEENKKFFFVCFRCFCARTHTPNSFRSKQRRRPSAKRGKRLYWCAM